MTAFHGDEGQKEQTNASACQPPRTSGQKMRGRHTRQMLPALLLAMIVLPTLLFVSARRQNARAAVQLADVNLSGSLRMRSMWMYGAGQPDAHVSLLDRATQRACMRAILDILHARYPADVAATSAAWAGFDADFRQKGQVNWADAVAMRDAADSLTRRIEGLAHMQAQRASWLLLCGMFAVGLSGLGSLVLLRRLRRAEEIQERLTSILDNSTDLIAMSDPHGRVTYYNAAFRRFLGLPPHGPLPVIFSPDTHAPWSREKMRVEGRPAALANGVWEGETALLHPTRGEVPMSQLVLAHHAPGGNLEGFSTVARDISERKRVEAALLEAEALFRSATGAMQEGFLVQDGDGKVLMANQCAEEILGLARDEMVGHKVMRGQWRTVHEDGALFVREDYPSRRAMKTGRPVSDVVLGIDKPEQPMLWLSISAAPLFRAGDAAPYAAVTTFSDISAQKAAADFLRQTQERLQTVVGNAPMILFSLNADGMFTMSEGKGLELLGMTPGQAVGESMFDLLGDKPLVCANLRRALAGETVGYVDELAGHIWDTQCRPLQGAGGGVEGIIGVSYNVTARHQAEEALRRGEERLRRLYEVTADADLSFSVKQDRLLQMGCLEFGMEVGIVAKMDAQTFEVVHSYGTAGHSLQGQTCDPQHTFCREAVIHGEPLGIENIGGSAWASHPAYQTWKPEAYLGAEVRVGDRDFGSLCFTSSHIRPSPFTAGDKDLLRLMAQWLGNEMQRQNAEQQMRDYNVVLEYQKGEMERANNELEQANARLASLAATDGLTGLYNRRALNERLTEEVVRARRYNCPLSLVLLDVDHFKQYNDTFGHPAGDWVLQTVGRMLCEQARITDIAARYGGEEFVVVLPETDAIGAGVVAERIRHALQIHDWPERAVTVSVGVCTLGAGTADADALLLAADSALYRSKSAGRNCVTHAQAPQPHMSAAAPKRTRHAA